MALGFNEQVCSDSVYFDKYGFPYCIITLKLTKTIYIDWEKENGLAKMVRINNNQDCDIMQTMPIINLEHLKDMVRFFLNNPK